MGYSQYLARRLSLSSGGRKKSPAIKVSVTAVALSIAIMLAAISIVTGFKREIREKVTGFNSHITIYAVPSQDNDNLISLTPTLEQIISEQPFIDEYSLEASIPAIIKTPGDFKGIYMRSLNSKVVSEFLKSNVVEGKIPDFTKPDNADQIVISSTAANQLGLKAGDKIDVYFIAEELKVQRLKVSAIYNSHFDSYDDVMAYGALATIQKIAGIKPTQGTSIQLHTDNFDMLNANTAFLQQSMEEAMALGLLYKPYRIENALSQGEGYFNWLSLLDTNVIVILALMTVVAIATLISGMLILILDKKHFIGIIRALGSPISGVRKVFVNLAMKVAFYGLIIGNVFMLVFLYCQDRFHFLPLDADAYYIDFVPVELNWWSILILNVVCVAIIYLSLLLPSRFVAKISPTDAMRMNE